DDGADRSHRSERFVDGCPATRLAGTGSAGDYHRAGFWLCIRTGAVATARNGAGPGEDDCRAGLRGGAQRMSALALKGTTLPEILLKLETCTRWGARFVAPSEQATFYPYQDVL